MTNLTQQIDGKRFVVYADEKLTAFVELESAICNHQRLAGAIGWMSWCILTITVVCEYKLRHDQRGFDVFFLHLRETGLLWH